MKKRNLILFHNTMFDMPLSFVPEDIPEGYEITTDRKALPDAAAVVFHLPSLFPLSINILIRRIPSLASALFRCQRPPKKKGQLWVAWFMESEVNYPHFTDLSFMNSFDLTMSYHLDSDIVYSYFYSGLKEQLRGPVQEKTDERNICAFISSPFHKSGRLEYLKTLMDCLDVHSYGKVLRNKMLENDEGRETKMRTFAGYKFTIAFENSIASDYVTEKFYDPLIAGSIPIYLGAPNIEDFAPGDQCFINTADWGSPESLCRYILQVSKDEKLYERFFQWRSEPFRPAFVRLMAKQREHPFVRLCRKIQERGRFSDIQKQDGKKAKG